MSPESEQPISDFVVCKEEIVDGETDWYWVKGDENAWSGPTENWIGAHRDKYYKHLKKRDVVITAGANCGLHCRFFAKTFGRVYAFEPNPLAFYCLNLNAPYANVIKMQAALGAACEMVRIKGDKFSTGLWSLVGEGLLGDGWPVPCFSIDSFELDACDFIQLDVEGYENQVLVGARETIRKFQPVIACENGKTSDITVFMNEMGYIYEDQSAADAIWVPKKQIP